MTGTETLTTETTFSAFMRAMGLNRKEVSKAGAMLGYSSTAARMRNADDDRLTETDRLAMAAVRAGLPPWSPETDEEILRTRQIRELVDSAAQKKEG